MKIYFFFNVFQNRFSVGRLDFLEGLKKRFPKTFSKGFCFERLFRFFVIQKTFSKGFCFEGLLQKSHDYYVLKNIG